MANSIKLSVLVCTVQGREHYLERLMSILEKQADSHMEILMDSGPGSIGEKRNRLLSKASGKYVCFIDDDDTVTDDYYEKIKPGIDGNYDCCVLRGMYYVDGVKMKPFYHSNVYDRYYDDAQAYYRYPNHLNVIKTEIARQIGFLPISHGEDTDFATRLKKSGLIKNEFNVDEITYNYLYRSKK